MNLTKNEYKVYFFMAANANQGTYTLGIETVAKSQDLNRTTAQRSVTNLREKGLIALTSRGGGNKGGYASYKIMTA